MNDQHLLKFVIDLTPRQREVLRWVCEGLTNAEIARRLYIEPCGVAEHLTNIFAEAQIALYDHAPRINRYVLIRLCAPVFANHPDLFAPKP